MKIYDYRYGETTLEFYKDSEGKLQIVYSSENETQSFELSDETEMQLLKFLLKV